MREANSHVWAFEGQRNMLGGFEEEKRILNRSQLFRRKMGEQLSIDWITKMLRIFLCKGISVKSIPHNFF